MKIILLIISVCLLIFLLIFIGKYFYLKMELKQFKREVIKHKQQDYGQPLKVSCFDKDIVSLANALNEHINIQKSFSISYQAHQKELAKIISGISHDFRTPLTASLGYLQMIEKNGTLSDINREYLEIIISKNEYLKQLSDDFFELSKIENNDEEIDMEEINLSNAVSKMMLEQYYWIEKQKIKPNIEISDEILISSNFHYVKRILENIFSNAEKYTKSNLKVVLKKDVNTITLSVLNDMEDADNLNIDNVFLPFYRTSSRNKNGSGLGLYIVKCLADKLEFQVDASLDENNCFVITVALK